MDDLHKTGVIDRELHHLNIDFATDQTDCPMQGCYVNRITHWIDTTTIYDVFETQFTPYISSLVANI